MDMRLFIAINFDEDSIAEIESFQKDLMDIGIKGNFTPSENLHLTVAFIGEYGNPDDIIDIMEEVPFDPFSIRIEKIELHRDMYFAIMTNHPSLQSYVRRIRRELANAGIPFDKKAFLPHVTLVRKATFTEKHPLIECIGSDYAIPVQSVSLMRSERGKRGMVYTEIGSIWATDKKVTD